MAEDWKVQGSDAWLDFRKGKLGASDCPTIMGENPYKTPYRLWKEKTGREKVFVNDAMKRGSLMEESARAWYERQSNEIVFTDVLVHPKYIWMIASLDGFNFNRTKVVEIKCPGIINHAMAMAGKVPPHNYGQLQHQMFVADVKEADFVSFDGTDGIIIPVARDDEYIDKMLEKEKEFIQWVLDDVFPGAPLQTVGSKVYEKLEEYKIAKGLAEEWKSRADMLKDELIQATGEKDVETSSFSLKKAVFKGSVDYSKVPELEGIDLEAYRKESKPRWTLLLKKEST